jgi:hypothetical protein
LPTFLPFRFAKVISHSIDEIKALSLVQRINVFKVLYIK